MINAVKTLNMCFGARQQVDICFAVYYMYTPGEPAVNYASGLGNPASSPDIELQCVHILSVTTEHLNIDRSYLLDRDWLYLMEDRLLDYLACRLSPGTRLWNVLEGI